MKLRFQTIFVFFLALGVIGTSCNKDDDDGGGSSSANSFTFDGDTYNLTKGFIENYGSNQPDFESFDFDVTLGTDGISIGGSGYLEGTGDAIYLDFNSSDADGLAAGTYTYNSAGDREPMSIVDGSVGADINFTGSTGNLSSVTGGTVTVAKDGNQTSFQFNLTVAGGKAVTGSFKGNLAEF